MDKYSVCELTIIIECILNYGTILRKNVFIWEGVWNSGRRQLQILTA